MGAKGFTLVELLVSMALLSMVMVGMLSVMRSMAQAQDRVEHRLDDSDDLRVATAFIDNVMGHVSARKPQRALGTLAGWLGDEVWGVRSHSIAPWGETYSLRPASSAPRHRRQHVRPPGLPRRRALFPRPTYRQIWSSAGGSKALLGPYVATYRPAVRKRK